MFGDDGVDIGRGDARSDHLANELMRLPDADAGLTHKADFTFGFKLDHCGLVGQANVWIKFVNSGDKGTTQNGLAIRR